MPVLEMLHDAQRMQVVVEAQAIVLHGFIERLLAGMPEWGMAYIVRQGQSFSQVLIQAQRRRQWCARSAPLPRCGSGGCESGPNRAR